MQPDLTLLELVRATHADVAQIRHDLAATRQQVAALAAETAADRREVERLRQDDRRELDGLGETVRRLSGRERWIAGGMAVLGVLVVPVALVMLAEAIR